MPEQHNPNTQFHMDSPIFPKVGRSAGDIFRELQEHGLLRNDVLTTGCLHKPDETKLRTESIEFTYGHQKSLADTVQWLAIRLDPLDFGRIIYSGMRPESGEPSWREVGAIAMEDFLERVTGLHHTLQTPDTREKQLLADTISFCAAIIGHRFDSHAGANGMDSRYAHLRVSWLGTPDEPHSKPFPQTIIVNAILEQIENDRDALIKRAKVRFDPTASVFHEIYLQDLSDDELAMMGVGREQMERLAKLQQDTDLPDVIPVERETYTGAAEPQIGPIDTTHDELIPEIDFPFILDECPDITELRSSLSNRGLIFDAIPRDIEEFHLPSHPLLCETHEGVRAVLIITPNDQIHDSQLELAEFLSKLHKIIEEQSADHVEYFHFHINKVANAYGENRMVLEIDLKLPAFTSENKQERRNRLITLFGFCIDSSDLFLFPKT